MPYEDLSTEDENELFQLRKSKASKKYACVFCLTGQEVRVAERITDLFMGTLALPVDQLRHKSVNGKKTITRDRAFPGYVFVEITGTLDTAMMNRVPGVLYVLTYDDGDWELRGTDFAIARWVFQHGGLIGVCQAHADGDKIVFTSGLLKDYSGSIIKVDKHRGNALIEIVSERTTYKLWVAFDWLNSGGTAAS